MPLLLCWQAMVKLEDFSRSRCDLIGAIGALCDSDDDCFGGVCRSGLPRCRFAFLEECDSDAGTAECTPPLSSLASTTRLYSPPSFRQTAKHWTLSTAVCSRKTTFSWHGARCSGTTKLGALALPWKPPCVRVPVSRAPIDRGSSSLCTLSTDPSNAPARGGGGGVPKARRVPQRRPPGVRRGTGRPPRRQHPRGA